MNAELSKLTNRLFLKPPTLKARFCEALFNVPGFLIISNNLLYK